MFCRGRMRSQRQEEDRTYYFAFGGSGTCVCALASGRVQFAGGLPVAGLTGCPYWFVCTQYPSGYCAVGGTETGAHLLCLDPPRVRRPFGSAITTDVIDDAGC